MSLTSDTIPDTMRMMDNKLKSFIIATLRRASFRWKPRGEAKKRYKVKVGEYGTGRAKYGYKCATCDGVYKSGEIKMDHIDPAVPLDGWQGFDVFIERLFCDEDGFQALCPACHDEKTGIERDERKKQRELKKMFDKDK
jgi:hypothetical protein